MAGCGGLIFNDLLWLQEQTLANHNWEEPWLYLLMQHCLKLDSFKAQSRTGSRCSYSGKVTSCFSFKPLIVAVFVFTGKYFLFICLNLWLLCSFLGWQQASEGPRWSRSGPVELDEKKNCESLGSHLVVRLDTWRTSAGSELTTACSHRRDRNFCFLKQRGH